MMQVFLPDRFYTYPKTQSFTLSKDLAAGVPTRHVLHVPGL